MLWIQTFWKRSSVVGTISAVSYHNSKPHVDSAHFLLTLHTFYEDIHELIYIRWCVKIAPGRLQYIWTCLSLFCILRIFYLQMWIPNHWSHWAARLHVCDVQFPRVKISFSYSFRFLSEENFGDCDARNWTELSITFKTKCAHTFHKFMCRVNAYFLLQFTNHLFGIPSQ